MNFNDFERTVEVENVNDFSIFSKVETFMKAQFGAWRLPETRPDRKAFAGFLPGPIGCWTAFFTTLEGKELKVNCWWQKTPTKIEPRVEVLEVIGRIKLM